MHARLSREFSNFISRLVYTDKLRQQCRKLAQLSGQIGRTRPELMEGLRSFVYGNYVIFFMYNNDYLDIVTIIEGHRDIETMFDD
ncbi:MAG: type II toxin-antitoxin system RelE/ParE family toxin [Candidatus Scalindua sp. AMX11]|nr:type II toxin-antitoxin system RelE/ParE family toxin [Planctomycetota bacterium]RZV61141.1 MAG: type II toxin-antitoxin system RelE/ParE family toxin [Candidatus Scalindua sp. SCAELEC01]TDE63174.1 MAG: type II toxin-antitoxin system RelE/ParE family toxin [Candidatus Scalindua sp. AMX11]